MDKKKKVMSMEEEDKIFFERAMKNPEIRKQIERDEKEKDNIYRQESKRMISEQQKRKKAVKPVVK